MKEKLLFESELNKQILSKKINDSFEEVAELARTNDSTFATRFQEVYPEFSEKLKETHPKLTKTEFELCALVFLNYSSKEIAGFQFVEHRSVQTRKSRLRKKLSIPPAQDLYNYLTNLT